MASFHQYARKVVNPRLDVTTRYLALGTCIRKVCWKTYRGCPAHYYNGLRCFEAHYAATRARFNKRFGFDNTTPAEAERLVDALAAIEVERNKMLEVERILYRRRVNQKARGIRQPSRAYRKAAYDFWEKAVLSLEKDED